MKRISALSSRLRTRLMLTMIGLIVLASALLITVMYNNFKQYALQSARQRLQDLVSVAALQIDGDQHAQLTKAEDEQGPNYQTIDTIMQSVQKTGKDVDSLYTMRTNADGKIYFVVDSAVDEHSSLGTEYDDPGPALAELMAHMNQADHAVVEEDFYTDQWGTWISGYAPIYRSNGQVDGILGMDMAAGAVIAEERNLLILSLSIFGGVVLLGVVLSMVISGQISRPIAALARSVTQIAENDIPALVTALDEMAHGDLNGSISLQAVEIPVRSKDEIGEMTVAFNDMVIGLQQVGESFVLMSSRLREMIGVIRENAGDLDGASRHLVVAAGECAHAAQQIAVDTQEVSRGTVQQSQAVSSTANSVKQMSQAIEGVALGAQEQARAVQEAAELMEQLSASLNQLARAAQNSADGGEAARSASDQGRARVENVIASVQAIREQVGCSAKKVQEMGQRSEEIGNILSTIEEIASQTNLLALNAAIETARAEAQSVAMAEEILNVQMVAQAQIVNQILIEKPAAELDVKFWSDLTRRAGMDAIYITDADGVVVCSNDPEFIGWRFPEDPKEQASVFRKLIHTKDGIVCQKTQKNSRYNRLAKYAGVSRLDEPGIVQIAFPGEALKKFQLNLGGFGVVATEVRKLSERSTEETKAISALIVGIQKAVSEAMAAMNMGAARVEEGVERAEQAGAALESIVQTARVVFEESTQAVQVARQALAAATELSAAVESVSAVVEENSAAMEEMSAGSGDMDRAIESIAVVSVQNSASVEDVSAATEQISAQMEDVMSSSQALAGMANALMEVIASFRIDEENAEFAFEREELSLTPALGPNVVLALGD